MGIYQAWKLHISKWIESNPRPHVNVPISPISLPPLEKRLWVSLSKIKTSPKLKHFLWKALAGALAVVERLQTRGIAIDPLCLACRDESESICHDLFHCHAAIEVWEMSWLPLPPAGFSHTLVMLNLHYLLKCNSNPQIDKLLRLIFPWLLWQLWKAPNKVIFEQVRYDPSSIFFKAKEEATIWLSLNGHIPMVKDSGPSLLTVKLT